MKTKNTLIPAAIAAAIALNISSTTADAAYGTDLSRYAHRIDKIAHELSDEFRLHYKHLGAYRHLKSDIAHVISKVHHIDGLTHDPHSSLRHIKSDLSSLDRLAHHMHEVVDSAESGRYGGHAHGDTRHVHSLLSSLNGAIHSMQRITERMSHCDLGDGHHYDGHSRHGRDHGGYRRHDTADAAARVLRFVFERRRGHY